MLRFYLKDCLLQQPKPSGVYYKDPMHVGPEENQCDTNSM
jgi:hypothetical protein